MSLYIQQLAKLIGNQLGRLYRHFGANSDCAAWFLICTSLISQQNAYIQNGRDSQSGFATKTTNLGFFDLRISDRLLLQLGAVATL
jgi:hypothetical protein